MSRRNARFWRGALLTAGLTGLVVGLVLVGAGGSRRREVERIARDFKPAAGTVVDTQNRTKVTHLPSAHPLGLDRGTRITSSESWVRIEYTVAGVSYDGWVVDPIGGYNAGELCSFWYDPADPRSVVLERHADPTATVVFDAGVVVLLVGMVSCATALTQRRGRPRLSEPPAASKGGA